MWKRRLRPRLEPNSQESVKESHGLEAAGGWPRKCKSHDKLEQESNRFGYTEGGTEGGGEDAREGLLLKPDRQENAKVL